MHVAVQRSGQVPSAGWHLLRHTPQSLDMNLDLLPLAKHTHTHSRVARSCKQTQQWQQQQDMAAAPLVPPWWSPCPSLTRTSLWHRGAHQLGKSGHLTPVRSHCQEGTFQPLLKRRLRAVPFVEQQIQHHVIKPQHLQEPVMVWQDRLGFWQIMTVNARHERHMCSN